MASVSDTTVTSGRPRPAGTGIVLAGDRTTLRARARRHSAQVKLLKYALPLSTVAIFGLYGLSVLQTTGWGAGFGELAIPQIIPENIAMENPHYEGFNKDGGRYWVRAKTAQQDLKNLNLIKLNGITGELMDAKKLTTKLAATRGTFDNKANLLELFDAIDISGETGLKARLTRATVKTKENIITSDRPVSVAMDAGTITANSMTVRQKSKEYTFVENVRTILKPRPPQEGAAPVDAAAPMTFGNASEPVDIVAKRLDINDAAKVAIFTGAVKAVQGQSAITTPEMEVTYEGSATQQAGGTEQAGAQNPENASRVKRIVAKDPVVLTQSTGDRVTSRSADFDAISQKAVLDGDVVMTQAPDKRAVGDRAEIDQANNTILLTGPVAVTQGINELKGRRLFFDRTNSKMQLTAQGGPGRVTARFQQGDTKSAPKPADNGEPKQGVAFGATFKTDPGAPVNVEADRLDVDDRAKQAVFSGDVRAIQGDFVIRSAELTATYSGSAGLNTGSPVQGQAAVQPQTAAKINRIQARKKVQVTSKDGQNASGDWADFDTRANTATLGGDVVLTQNKNVVRGTKLVIDMTTGESVIKTEATSTSGSNAMTSSRDSAGEAPARANRPSAVFYPGELKAQAGKAASGAAAASGDGAGSAWSTRSAPSNRP
jgi:lipopolysaccharide transport protein LptA/LPS export ABC transporter protein LptC